MAPKNSFISISFSILMCFCAVKDLNAQSSQAQPTADSLKQELSLAKTDTDKIKILYSLALAKASSDSAAAFKYANQCMELSKQAKWVKGTGMAFLALGKIYKQLTNFNDGLQNSQTAYDIFKKINDRKYMAMALASVGTSYSGLGNYTKALEAQFEALQLFEEIGETPGIEKAYNNIGVAYYYLLDYDKAIANYKKAIPLAERVGDKYGVASGLDNIAIAYMDQGRLDSANIYDLQAIKIFEAINNEPALARIYCNRGLILAKLYDAESAFEFYNRAIAINEKLGIGDQLGSVYENIGELYLDLSEDSSGKFNTPPDLDKDKKSLLGKSHSYFAKAIPLIKNSGDIRFLVDATQLASATEEQLGNYQAALALYKDHALYKDSIYNDANKKKIAAMEMQRLADVKNKEIQLKTAEVNRQTLIRNIILASVVVLAILAVFLTWSYNRRKKLRFDKQMGEVEMKALRAQMNPHFIFNSLHSINKYVIENDKENASEYLSKFANLMRLILENSREQDVPLDKDLHALELYMQLETLRFKNKFDYQIETGEGIDAENTLIPPMLLQPFVENSILHGFQHRDNGLIKISVNKEQDMIKCVVEDNGSGRKNLEEDESGKRKSLGLQIIMERLHIIDQIKKVKPILNIFDLKDDENRPRGLRIELLLPYEAAV